MIILMMVYRLTLNKMNNTMSWYRIKMIQIAISFITWRVILVLTFDIQWLSFHLMHNKTCQGQRWKNKQNVTHIYTYNTSNILFLEKINSALQFSSKWEWSKNYFNLFINWWLIWGYPPNQTDKVWHVS